MQPTTEIALGNLIETIRAEVRAEFEAKYEADYGKWNHDLDKFAELLSSDPDIDKNIGGRYITESLKKANVILQDVSTNRRAKYCYKDYPIIKQAVLDNLLGKKRNGLIKKEGFSEPQYLGGFASQNIFPVGHKQINIVLK